MGGSRSAEFQVLVQSGEDVIAACVQCAYAANLEVATDAAAARAAARTRRACRRSEGAHAGPAAASTT